MTPSLANMGIHAGVVAPPYRDCPVVLVNLQSSEKYYRLSATLTMKMTYEK